jgi:hypothetical protein
MKRSGIQGLLWHFPRITLHSIRATCCSLGEAERNPGFVLAFSPDCVALHPGYLL